MLVENSTTWFPDIDTNHYITLDITSITHAEPYLDNNQLHIDDGKGLVILISHIICCVYQNTSLPCPKYYMLKH